VLNEASVALAARIVLAIVLASSAIAKFRSGGAVREQVAALVSPRVAPMVAPLLPASELAVAAGLVAWWSAVPGVVAVFLLVAFTVVLVRAQARRVPCLCFGVSSLATPVGPASVVRNGVLTALAVLAIGTPEGASATTFAVGTLFAVAAALAIRAAR
jgi:Methylamine utilisation protein MauE